MLGMSRGAWIRPWAWALALAGLLAITAPAALAQAVATSGGANPPPLRKGTGLPVPRFATVRAEETNVRTGPGPRYPIDWVFKRKGMPVEIVGEYENYRKIRDWQGAGGWVHASLLTGKRYVIAAAAYNLSRILRALFGIGKPRTLQGPRGLATLAQLLARMAAALWIAVQSLWHAATRSQRTLALR